MHSYFWDTVYNVRSQWQRSDVIINRFGLRPYNNILVTDIINQSIQSIYLSAGCKPSYIGLRDRRCAALPTMVSILITSFNVALPGYMCPLTSVTGKLFEYPMPANPEVVGLHSLERTADVDCRVRSTKLTLSSLLTCVAASLDEPMPLLVACQFFIG